MEKENITLDDVRKIAASELEKTIRETLDSSLIFTYISKLEKEVSDKKDGINYINRLMDNILDKGATYDLLAVLVTLKCILDPEKVEEEIKQDEK